MKLSPVLQASFLGAAVGEIQWTSDQAEIISRKSGYDTSNWNVDATKRRNLKRGIANSNLATRWNTEDANGKLKIRYYHPYGEGIPAASEARAQTQAALDELSRYMNNCIYFRVFNECDKTQDVSCVPEQIASDNHVRVTCGPSNTFDQGCYANLGMVDGSATAVNLESSSCSNDNNHCFSKHSGMGAVHQQFLHVLGVAGEHQRNDASSFITVQASNLNLSADQISERYDALPLANWQQDGFSFDFNSVMLSSFYDNNFKTVDQLVQNYNPAEYSVLRNSDNTRPVWANKHRASTTDMLQLVSMYPKYCSNSDLLQRTKCADGVQKVFVERICDRFINDCDDGSDETESCYTGNQYGCCTAMTAYFNIFHQFPGELSAELVRNGYSTLYNRPTFNAPLNRGMVVDEFRLAPLEVQSDPANCGKSPQITWVPYYAATGAPDLTCENYSTLAADTSSQTYVIYDHLKYDEPWDKPVFCIQDFPSSFLEGTEAATTFKVTCDAMPIDSTTTTTTTTTTVAPPPLPGLPDRPVGEATTTVAGGVIGPEKPTNAPTTTSTTTTTTSTTLMVDDNADSCCEQHLIDLNYFNAQGFPTDVGVELTQFGTSVGLDGRHKYMADIVGTNFHSQTGQQAGEKIFLIPFESQANAADCGSSKDVTWMLFIADSIDVFTWHTGTCADAQKALDGTDAILIAKVNDDKRTGAVCPLDVSNAWSHIQGEDTYNFYCGDLTTTTSEFTQSTPGPDPTQPGGPDIPITAVNPIDNTSTDGSLDGVDLSVNPCDGKCPSGNCISDPSAAPHGVQCSCPLSGYNWVGDALTGACTDIDECAEGGIGESSCAIADGTKCDNTVGGYQCICADGFELNDSQQCIDIDECADGSSNCTQGCTNKPGGFDCGCSDGYTYNADTNTCDDVNECDASLCDSDANCAVNQCGLRNRCNNLIGGWSCSCANADGEFDGANIWNSETGRCEDLNECEPQNGAAAACSPGSDCVNTSPGFSCSCKEGYTDTSTALDGSECVWSRYPESFVNIPGFTGNSIDAANSLFYISSNEGGKYQDVNAAKGALQGMNNFRSLKCEEYFGLPHGIVKPGSMYLCDDSNSRLTHARYSNQGRGWCVFQDYSVKCSHNGSTTLPGSFPLGSDAKIDFIAVSTNGGACHWDRDNSEIYNDESNGMGVMDTALCQMQVSNQQEAALVCHAYGGRLFNEEVDNTTPQDPNYVQEVNGCLSYVDNYAKARGRLYQAKKVADRLNIDISNKQMLTAYQDCELNGGFFAAGADNWCYLNYSPIGSTTWFGLPTLPMDQTPIGGHINHSLPWTNNANGYDCGIEMIADQVNAAMATGMDNIQSVVPGMALVWDVAEKQYKMRGHDSSFDFFVCERNAWDCDLNGATLCPSGSCNPAGYCDCPAGQFLDATTNQCIQKPDPVKIECFDDRMVAHFSVDSINAVDESNPLELLDGCGDQVSKVDGYWRVETRLDECGTVANYGQNNEGEDIIIFHNYLNNQIQNNVGAHSQTHTDPNFQQTVFINKHSQVMSKFECHYRMITTVDDVNNYMNEDIGPCDGPPELCTGGPGGGPPGPGGIGVEAASASMERSALGRLSFELKLFDSNTFRTEMPADTKSRVGENLYFGVAATKKLTNIVHRATRCTIKGGDATNMAKKDEYVLFDDVVGEVDPYVETTRYSPFHMDGLGQQTCANEDLDKFSYRVFEFIDPVTNLPAQNSNQHISCTVAVCIADEDMSSGPCGPSVCDYWNTNNDVEAADSTAPRRFG